MLVQWEQLLWCVRADEILAPTPQQQFSEVLYKCHAESVSLFVFAHVQISWTNTKRDKGENTPCVCGASRIIYDDVRLLCIASPLNNEPEKVMIASVCVCAQKSYWEKAAGTAGSRAEGQRSDLWSQRGSFSLCHLWTRPELLLCICVMKTPVRVWEREHRQIIAFRWVWAYVIKSGFGMRSRLRRVCTVYALPLRWGSPAGRTHGHGANEERLFLSLFIRFVYSFDGRFS